MDFLARLRDETPLLTVELRPPRADLELTSSMDSWIGMNATVSALSAQDTLLFLTDSAVGTREEENLHHLLTNLDDELSRDKVCPFLTTKHTLEYCMWYAARAVEAGCPALTVLGGDRGVGPPRCVPHGYVLRQLIRERFPKLALGGWANPHARPERQVGYMLEDEYTAEFYLTQLVSHVDPEPIDRFLGEVDRQGVTLPGIFGVFFYRSARRKTLERLADYFPVPVEALLAEFDAGLTAEQICAKTIRALRDRGVSRVYVSNLHPDRAAAQLRRIRRLVDEV